MLKCAGHIILLLLLKCVSCFIMPRATQNYLKQYSIVRIQHCPQELLLCTLWLYMRVWQAYCYALHLLPFHPTVQPSFYPIPASLGYSLHTPNSELYVWSWFTANQIAPNSSWTCKLFFYQGSPSQASCFHSGQPKGKLSIQHSSQLSFLNNWHSVSPTVEAEHSLIIH